jgi:hypothetical protein
MHPSKAMAIIRQVYDLVESALWAGLIAFVLYFVIYIVPTLPEVARRAESIRSANIAAENSAWCEKWRMKRGTHEHTLCTMDLQEFRDKIEDELARQDGIF